MQTGTYAKYALVAFLIIALDYATKAWVVAQSVELPYVLFTGLFGVDLQITHVVNTGAAWGVFSDFPRLLVLFRIGLISALLVYLLAYNRHTSWGMPLACIISGAIGNVFDYFHYGYVVDMIQFCFWGYDYPVFNVADSAVCLGSLRLLYLAYTEKAHEHS